MPNTQGSRNLYLNKDNAEVLDRFTADELALLVKEGKGLFELTMKEPSEEEWEYLVSHPELMKVIEKW
jgi:hypothetical protein